MHSALFVLAAAGSVGLLTVVSVAVGNVAASMSEARGVVREAGADPREASVWDGIERRTGVDRRWRALDLAAAVDTARTDRRDGGRRATDRPSAARVTRAA